MRMNAAQKKILVACYAAQAITLDDLHHTCEFKALCDGFNQSQKTGYSQHDIYDALISLRKSGKLPRKTDRRVKKKVRPAKSRVQTSFLEEE